MYTTIFCTQFSEKLRRLLLLSLLLLFHRLKVTLSQKCGRDLYNDEIWLRLTNNQPGTYHATRVPASQEIQQYSLHARFYVQYMPSIMIISWRIMQSIHAKQLALTARHHRLRHRYLTLLSFIYVIWNQTSEYAHHTYLKYCS